MHRGLGKVAIQGPVSVSEFPSSSRSGMKTLRDSHPYLRCVCATGVVRLCRIFAAGCDSGVFVGRGGCVQAPRRGCRDTLIERFGTFDDA